MNTRRRLGVSDTPVTRVRPDDGELAQVRQRGDAGDAAADLRVGERLLDRREQVVDRRFRALEERGGDALRPGLDRDRPASAGSSRSGPTRSSAD